MPMPCKKLNHRRLIEFQIKKLLGSSLINNNNTIFNIRIILTKKRLDASCRKLHFVTVNKIFTLRTISDGLNKIINIFSLRPATLV